MVDERPRRTFGKVVTLVGAIFALLITTVSPLGALQPEWVEEAKLVQPADEGWFARSIAVSGDTAVVGTLDPGAVYVYRLVGGEWSQQARLAAPDDAEGSNAFGLSVGLSGNVLVVGAPFDDQAGEDAGAAYVFESGPSGWEFVTKLMGSDAGEDQQFGWAVDIDGSTMVVGAPHAGFPAGLGAAFVFGLDGQLWIERARLTASDGDLGDSFGRSVSVDGKRITVGAPSDDDAGLSSGSIYVFDDQRRRGFVQRKLLAPDAAASSFFGQEIASDGGTIVVSSGLFDSGKIYVFEQSRRTGLAVKQQFESPAGVCWFGTSPAIDGDTFVVGAPSDFGCSPGAAFVYARTGPLWSLDTVLEPSDGPSGGFGFPVAIFEDVIAVADAFEVDPPNAVYIFGR